MDPVGTQARLIPPAGDQNNAGTIEIRQHVVHAIRGFFRATDVVAKMQVDFVGVRGAPVEVGEALPGQICRSGDAIQRFALADLVPLHRDDRCFVRHYCATSGTQVRPL
jgi:hypothetical protein